MKFKGEFILKDILGVLDLSEISLCDFFLN